MSYECEVRMEKARGCGYRKSGEGGVGLYLVSDGMGMGCDRMPFPLFTEDDEPIKHFRGLKEINPIEMFPDNKEPIRSACDGWCLLCLMGGLRQNYGLLHFVGQENYTLDEFNKEAARMGISRRISNLPNSFVVGQHWVYLVHAEAGSWLNPITGQIELAPAIFRAFKPKVELVIDDPEKIPDRAKMLKDRYGENATIVKVVPV